MLQDTETSKRCMATINVGVRVIQLHAEVESYPSTAEDTGISKTLTQRIIKHWSDTGEVEPRMNCNMYKKKWRISSMVK
jgi:hypothetical protein